MSYLLVILGGWAVDYCGGYKGAKQRVTALKMCSVFGKHLLTFITFHLISLNFIDLVFFLQTLVLYIHELFYLPFFAHFLTFIF